MINNNNNINNNSEILGLFCNVTNVCISIMEGELIGYDLMESGEIMFKDEDEFDIREIKDGDVEMSEDEYMKWYDDNRERMND